MRTIFRILAILLAGITTLLPQNGRASGENSALEAAIQVCTNLGEEKTAAQTSLVEAGWAIEPEPDFNSGLTDDPLRGAMFSLHFALNHDVSDSAKAHYSLANSVFMMGSILGNSPLRQTPPTFTQGAITLLLVGLKLDTPYCVLSGPFDLAETLDRWPETKEQNDILRLPPSRYRDVISTIVNGSRVTTVQLDLPALQSRIQFLTSTPAKQSLLPPQHYSGLLAAIRPVNVQITPPSANQ